LIATLKKLRKSSYLQTILVDSLIVLIVFGFWFGSQLVLNTKIPPALAVVSGSMCIPYDGDCEGWTSINHPFAPTLHKGDIIIIQGVDPKDLNANYPNSDIIVFRKPDNIGEFIVHRIVKEETINGKIYFYTKGDGNPPTSWPNPTETYDQWNNNAAGIPRGAVSEDLVVGKVIMRIPWIGWIPIKMQEIGVSGTTTVIPIIVVLILLLIIAEFLVPVLRNRHKPTQQTTHSA
jgi:signal peptidase I